jgi:hypothetical protein
MSFGPGDTEPSIVSGGEIRRSLPPNTSANHSPKSHSPHSSLPNQVVFNRRELNRILDLYGRMVATGEWRDYAIDFLRDRAVFSIFRRASEVPIYRIEKDPKLARRQGAYSVISATGLILRRGHELDRVIQVLEKPLRVVASRA